MDHVGELLTLRIFNSRKRTRIGGREWQRYLKPKIDSNRSGSASVNIQYSGNSKMPNYDKPELVFADTAEEALTFNVDYYFKGYLYANKVNDIIKVFENDEYLTMFYHSTKNSKKEAFVCVKFKVKSMNGKKQYALILSTISEAGKRFGKPLDGLRRAAPLYDYLSEYGISEKNRFIFDTIETENIKTLKIEDQSPTEVIEYTLLGKKEYFWYYKNLISDKPSSQFDIEMKE
ncbi:hypothetical protein [Lacrimispora sp.]|uniref:hypothetical protein n=1 Tax=Lacrimispora sp. TaxID=2719234 RepID=UPI003217D943